MAADNLDVMSV